MVPPAVPVETPVRPERDGEEGDAGRGGDGAARRRRERERGEAKPLGRLATGAFGSSEAKATSVRCSDAAMSTTEATGGWNVSGHAGSKSRGRAKRHAKAKKSNACDAEPWRCATCARIFAKLARLRAIALANVARPGAPRIASAALSAGVRGAEGGDGDVRLAHRRGVRDAAPDERRDAVAAQRRDE